MKNKRNKGITLIALVVTIIVLLILAGISITMLTGNNGILNMAGEAKENTEKSNIIERAQIYILEKQTENQGSLSANELEEILISPNYGIQGTLSDEESILNRTLTSKDGQYTIPVSDIYNGPLKTNEQPMISFEISTYGSSSSIELRCEEGMTWAEWAREYNEPIYLSLDANEGAQQFGYFKGSLQDFILLFGLDDYMWYERSDYMVTDFSSNGVMEKPGNTIKDISAGGRYYVYGGYNG